ncbi:MAG: lipocalin family protein [Fibrobacteres bacterium]|nr:lipocalin family protein [Fibrobacterota bacterium]
MRTWVLISLCGILAGCDSNSSVGASESSPQSPATHAPKADPLPPISPLRSTSISLDQLGVQLDRPLAAVSTIPDPVESDPTGLATIHLETNQTTPPEVFLKIDAQDSAYRIDPLPGPDGGYDVQVSGPPNSFANVFFSLFIKGENLAELRGLLRFGPAPDPSKRKYLRLQFSYDDPSYERPGAARYLIGEGATMTYRGETTPLERSTRVLDVTEICGQGPAVLHNADLRGIRFMGAEISTYPVSSVNQLYWVSCGMDTTINEITLPFRVNEMKGLICDASHSDVFGTFRATDWSWRTSTSSSPISLQNFHTYPSERGAEWKEFRSVFAQPSGYIDAGPKSVLGTSGRSADLVQRFLRLEGEDIRTCVTRGGSKCSEHKAAPAIGEPGGWILYHAFSAGQLQGSWRVAESVNSQVLIVFNFAADGTFTRLDANPTKDGDGGVMDLGTYQISGTTLILNRTGRKTKDSTSQVWKERIVEPSQKSYEFYLSGSSLLLVHPDDLGNPDTLALSSI